MSFNEKLSFEEWIQALYDYALHSVAYLRQNGLIAICNGGKMVYDVISQNLLIICDQAK